MGLSHSRPVEAPGQTVGASWRSDLLPHLKGLPLLPCGAGDDGKAPINPQTGRLLGKWQLKRWSSEEIQGMPRCVTSVGMRCGPDAGGIVAFDLDGQSAIQAAEDAGCRLEDSGWVITRATAPDRCKVLFKVPAEHWPTDDDPREGKRKRAKNAGEQVEVFWSSGQIIVAGLHQPSGAFLQWRGGPESLTDLPPAWLEFWEAAAAPAVKPAPAPHRGEPAMGTGAIPLQQLLSRELEDLAIHGCHEGDRDDTCFRLAAGALAVVEGVRADGRLSIDGTVERLILDFAARCSPPFPEAEALKCLSSAESQPRTPDPGLADRIAFQVQQSAKGGQASPQRPVRRAGGAATEPSSEEVTRLPYRDLLADTLQAIRDADENKEMELRAEIMGRFKRNDSQINTALFNLMTKQEGGTIEATYGAIDLDKIAPSHWIVDGFVPANDQVLLYGEAGAGKTTAALELAFAVIDGTSFLDRSAPATTGKVLFISSDSGKGPLLRLINHAGFINHDAVRDGRFSVWAHSPEEGRLPWDASVAGCLALLKAIQSENISLVLIDSCKAVTCKADLDYTSNMQIASLLTFFQEVVCKHCSVVWLNHDGVAAGATAGAKAWKEIPSSVHSIELVPAGDEHGKAKAGRVSTELRNWRVRKCRQGTARDFLYSVDRETGRLKVADAVEIVGDCSEAILQVLRDAYRQGQEIVEIQELQDRCLWLPGAYSSKTVRNTITNLVSARAIVRTGRGRYALSPKQKELLRGVHVGREDKGPNTSEGLGSSFVPTPKNARDNGTNEPGAGADVCPVVPAQKGVGTKENTSEGLGSHPLSSHDAWAPLREGAQTTAPRPDPGFPIRVDGHPGWRQVTRGSGSGSVLCSDPAGASRWISRKRITPEIAA